jgi:hypothetical protein
MSAAIARKTVGTPLMIADPIRGNGTKAIKARAGDRRIAKRAKQQQTLQ